ncbi:MAG: pyridoxal-phosphate dependent enzyme [Deltaproteobacteria bacterium]|nr:pyridoxal-phosphate dependent enzyme [Deltaproteobacteria bacterium]
MGVLHPLFEKWPALEGRLPVVPLGKWPTPVERVEGLVAGREIWVKRDDLSSPAYGGNKVRKLELVLAGRTGTVITAGALGSHHVLATAIHGRALGLACVGVLVPQPPGDHASVVLALNERHCERIVRVDRMAAIPALFGLAARAVRDPSVVHVVLPGASNALGTLGWVAAGLELASQAHLGLCPIPERVYVACGTGGTAAGLALGLALEGLETEVVAVRVASRLAGNRAWLGTLARRSLRLLRTLGANAPTPALRLRVEHRFVGPGYGRPTVAAKDAVKRISESAGLILETTYTGKALAALLHDAQTEPGRGAFMLVNTYGPVENLS